MGKGEIAYYKQFLLFPQCFPKTCMADTWKQGLVRERVKVSIFSNYRDTANCLRFCMTHIVGREKRAGKQPFSPPFSTMFSIPSQMNFIIRIIFNPFPHNDTFWRPWEQAFWKHCGKRKNCSKRAISPFPTVFSTCLDNFLHFCQIWNCRLQTLSVWKSLKFVVW